MKIYTDKDVEYWYDYSSKCWWCRKIDQFKNQIGDAEDAYTKREILDLVKEMKTRSDSSGDAVQRILEIE